MNRKLLTLATLALVATGANAKVKLPHILSDNMIIQQNQEANLWGWDKPGSIVEVSTSWSSQKYTAKTGKDGKWAVKVQTPKASYTPLSITFDDGDSESVLCSGKRGGETRCPAADHDRVIVDMRLHLGLVGFMRRNVADGLERTGEHAFGKLCFNAAFIAGLG